MPLLVSPHNANDKKLAADRQVNLRYARELDVHCPINMVHHLQGLGESITPWFTRRLVLRISTLFFNDDDDEPRASLHFRDGSVPLLPPRALAILSFTILVVRL